MAVLMRTDPFREMDRMLRHLDGDGRAHWAPMDAYRRGDTVVVEVDLPGVVPDTIDVTVEQDVLQVTAERRPGYTDDDQVLRTERPQGAWTRQVFLGTGLDTDRIAATYDAGVLRLRIPVAEEAKPHRIPVTAGDERRPIEA